MSLAELTDEVVYTWQTAGIANRVKKGIHRINALGLVVLPTGYPDTIILEDDEPDADDDDDSNDNPFPRNDFPGFMEQLTIFVPKLPDAP
ncbi:MAG: transcription factor Iwr1 [Chloroflexi bacterium]|nr:transcription factor Iwr1 [Chloroflexota bacterium]